MAYDIFDPILSEGEYRAWLGISAPTAQRQRSDGSGPPFVQLSERRIGYRKSAVELWLKARTIHRVGELVSAKQALDLAALGTTITETVAPEAAKASAAASRSSTCERQGAARGRRITPRSTTARITVGAAHAGDPNAADFGMRQKGR